MRLIPWFWFIVLGVVVLIAPVHQARAQTTDCGALDSPTGAGVCDNACTLVGDSWECDFDAYCGGDWVKAIAVSQYGGLGSDYSASGSCGTTSYFCCAHNVMAGAPVNKVVLIGTTKDDMLRFDEINSNMLQPAFLQLLGFIYGNSGNDTIAGSDFAGANYRDNLYGEGGDDIIEGMNGADWIDGGDGADKVYAGAGNDRVVGGRDHDELTGNDGNDVLCDTTEASSGGCTDNIMYGDGPTLIPGNNKLWHDNTAGPACAASNLDVASDAGAGVNDSCGDTNDWGALPWTQCDIDIVIEPAGCTDPN